MVEHGDGILIRKKMQRHFGGTLVVDQRLLDVSGLLEMAGNLGAGTVVVATHLFQGLSHPAVQGAPPRRADLGVGHVADAVMAEVVGVDSLLTYDAALPEFIQAVHDRIFALRAG